MRSARSRALPSTGAGPTRWPSISAIDPSGRFLYAVRSSNVALDAYAIDANTGALTPVDGSPFDASPSPYAIAVDLDGRFVYVGNDDAPDETSVFSVDQASGKLTAVHGSPFFSPAGLQPEIVIARLVTR